MWGDKGRNKIKGRIGPALYSVMETGDDVLAGVLAEVTLGPLVDVPIAFAGTCSLIVALYDVFGPGLSQAGAVATAASVGLSLVLAAALLMRKHVFIAVTQNSLICYRVSRLDQSAVRLLFVAPPSSVRLTGSGRGLLRSSVRYSGPGTGERGLRLTIVRPWQGDLDEVLTALALAGAAVEVTSGIAIATQLPQVPPLSRS